MCLNYYDTSRLNRVEERCDHFVEKLLMFIEMKRVPRVGMQKFGFSRKFDSFGCENDLEHTAIVAYMMFLFQEYFELTSSDRDFREVIAMAFLHDMPEVITGDTPHDGSQDRDEKNLIEAKIMDRKILNGMTNSTRVAVANHYSGLQDETSLLFGVDKISFMAMMTWCMRHGKYGFINPEGLWKKWTDTDSHYAVLAGTGRPLDTCFAHTLDLTRAVFERPLLILVVEAMYRALEIEVPEGVKTLY